MSRYSESWKKHKQRRDRKMCNHPREKWVGTADGIRCGECGALVNESAPVKAEPKPEPKEEPKKAAPKRGGKK